VPPSKLIGGNEPYGIAFSPDGTLLAVGFADAAVDLFDGHSLGPLPRPNVDGLRYGNLGIVTWSKDGKTLYAGGSHNIGGVWRVLAWANAGRGDRHDLPAGSNTVSGLAALPDGQLLVATQDPFLALLEPDGRPRWAHHSPKADFRTHYDVLAVSADGTIVDFGFEPRGKSPLRFDLRALKLSHARPPITRRSGQRKTDLLSKAGLMGTPQLSMASRSGWTNTNDHEP
jgi:WD40 repeat protein